MPQVIAAPARGEEDLRLHRDSSARQAIEPGSAHADYVAQPIAWGWLAGLTVLAAVLRAIALNQQLWFDEIVTLLDSARRPLSRILTTYDTQNQHMLYSILAHGSIRLFGEHAWALRLPAVIFGVACVPALYFFGRLVTTNREALAASALLAVNYQHVWFSQNARGYTGMLFWTLVASIFFLRSVNGARTRDWVCYGVAAALGIYTHLMAAFVVAGHAVIYLWLVLSRTRGASRNRATLLPLLYGFALCAAASLLLYAPVLSHVFARTIGAQGRTAPSDWSSPVWALREMVHGLSAGASGGLIVLLIAGLVLLSGLISYARENPIAAGLAVLPGLATAAAVLAARHNLWPRFFFFEIGFGLLFLLRGAMLWSETGAKILGGEGKLASRLSAAVILLMLCASVIPLRAAYSRPKQDYLGAMRFVEEQRRPGEAIVTVGVVTSPYQRYYGRSWPLVETEAQLNAALAGHDPVWLIYTMPVSVRAQSPEIWNTIQTQFTMVRVFPGTLAGGEIYVCKSRSAENEGAPGQGRKSLGENNA